MVGVVAAVAVVAGPAAGAAGAATTQSFTTPGTYVFTVPAGVSTISATAVGGAGGLTSAEFVGGEGASVGGTFSVTPGEQLAVGVGASAPTNQAIADGPGGTGGGGAGGVVGAGGGGASVLSLVPVSPGFTASDLLVAGGGGGAGFVGSGGNAGAPGATFGGSQGGAPGTSTAGGAGGIDSTGGGANGQAGSFGLGGLGGGQDVNANPDGGGGGGGGYYGGGGGAGGLNAGGGGGGGSSFIAASASDASGPTPTTASPGVTITFPTPTAAVSTGALALGSEPQGSVGPEQTVTVTNSGSVPLIVSGVQTGGVDPGDYLIADRCQQPVAAGGSCQVGVRFSPQAQGASSATLTILTNASNALGPVTLTGTGMAPTAGSTGPQGPAGPQGPQGPAGLRGPRGPAGTIVCQNTAIARALCSLEFVPGTFTAHGATKSASFRIQHDGRTIDSGSLPLKPGKVSRRKIGRLRRGRYTLIVSTGHGHKTKVLLRETFRVA